MSLLAPFWRSGGPPAKPAPAPVPASNATSERIKVPRRALRNLIHEVAGLLRARLTR